MAKPTESFGEVIHQYTDTLCTTQKQTSLTNSLLQDIAVFNEYDFTKVEDWLTDIETAGDLTNESQAKLAKAKARGLTHTLATKQSFLTSLGKKLRIYYDSNCATLIFIPIPVFYGYSTAGKGIPCSICPQIQTQSKEMQFHR